MPRRRLCITAIILFFFGVIAGTFTYGPARRVFVSPDRTVAVQSARKLEETWHASAVHGRIAVIFAGHLNQQASGSSFPETDFLDASMRQGIVRRAYYVVPDRVWSQVVAESIFGRELIVLPKTTDSGFTLLHVGGRIHVMPLSKYIPEGDEKVLAVIDPTVWSPQEHLRISNLFSSGLMASDLVVSIGAGK